MLGTAAKCCGAVCWLLVACATELRAQKAPYDVFPPAEAPYYRVRYEASDKPGELVYGVNYTAWIPPGAKALRGVIVHQHGCGEGSCKSGLTGAYDLHWQALAKKHDCALLSPSYEQPEKADCQMWCDPRNGSDAAFQKCLADLGAKSGHPELAKVPWALWGHSGGGHWAGAMVMLHPDRIAAAWLRSGVPLLKDDPSRKGIKAHKLPDAALKVPLMCNLGTKEGVTAKDKNFAGVWPANEEFFNEVRGKGGLVGVAVDPLSSHDCGNQRYLAIPWLDTCLGARLPKSAGDPLVAMPTDSAWLAPPTGTEAVAAAKFRGEPLKAAWLPNEAVARAWMEYVKDTKVSDPTPPPAPTDVRLKGNTLTWEAEADLESGLASFIIERDGQVLATVPEQGKNPFGRPVFQNLQYSDTPTQPLVPMQFTDTKAEPGKKHTYRVIAVNTAGLKSERSASVVGVPPAFGDEKTSWHGFDRYDFLMDEADLSIKPHKAPPDEGNAVRTPVKGQLRCVVVAPKEAAPGNPWSWRGYYFDHEPQAEIELLKRGFHVGFVWCDAGKPWDAWYAFLTAKHGLSKKPAFIGMSRGGRNAYTWATAHPDKVSCVYADNPAVSREALALLGGLAKNDVPLLHVCGSLDPILGNHTLVLESAYQQLGGRISVMIKDGAAHHPHSLRDPKPIADFIEWSLRPAGGEPPTFVGKSFTKTSFYGAEGDYREVPGEKTFAACRGPWFAPSYDRYEFRVDGVRMPVSVIVPKDAAPGKPWVFRADFVTRDTAVDLALLGKGFHVVTGPVPTDTDGPVLAQWNAVYKHLTGHGLSKTPVMEGAGGAAGEAYAWAIENPDKVSCVYGENPILRSHMTKAQPLDRLDVLAKAGVPLLHVCGGRDPWLDTQTRVLEKRYKELGGPVTVIVQEGAGHFPTAPKDLKPVVEFITRHQPVKEAEPKPCGYRFDGTMSREVLESYLARAISMEGLLNGRGDFEDNLRMLKATGAKFIGRSLCLWGGEANLLRNLERAKSLVAKVHAADPDMILQACVFEVVTKQVEQVPVPDWAFKALGREVEERNFRYADMLYPDGRRKDQWGRDGSVPDVSRPETKLWFYFLAASYIDLGFEAIHFGQAEIMNGNDRELVHWSEVLCLVRSYAARHARRHLVLCDAHVPSGGLVRDGKLLLDFHSFPLRVKEVLDKPQEAVLEVGFSDSIYGRSKGGVAPGGRKCDHLPYLVELDNWGVSRQPGQAKAGGIWVWGYDEITWFAHGSQQYRADWLRYAWDWVRKTDANGYLQMPGSRTMRSPRDGKRWYYANKPSPAVPDGLGDEEAIRAVWSADSARK